MKPTGQVGGRAAPALDRGPERSAGVRPLTEGSVNTREPSADLPGRRGHLGEMDTVIPIKVLAVVPSVVSGVKCRSLSKVTVNRGPDSKVVAVASR